MHYIVVIDAGVPKVVSNTKGTPRTFPKHKKANNFINSRKYLRERRWQIVDNISTIPGRFKVDL